MPNVICYSCSISCHTDHKLEELWLKRGLRCDCPTSRLHNKCQLKKEENIPENSNKYLPEHNFMGRYCWCDSSYDADAVVEEGQPDPNYMIQCHFCEDWFHGRCIENLPKSEDFQEFLCKDCVLKHPFMFHAINNDTIFSSVGNPINSNTVCCRQGVEICAEAVNLFLKEGWQDSLCKCSLCAVDYPRFVMEEEQIYEPEEDLNRFESTHDAAINLLDKVERSKFIRGFDAFEKLGSNLKQFLKPFADAGKVVTAEDVNEFFQKEKRSKLQE